MAAVAGPRRREPLPVWRWIVLLLAGAFFLLPLLVAFRFAGIKSFGSVLSQSGFTSSLSLSVRLAIVTTLITVILMLPTAVFVHLRLPKVRRVLKGITILPIVIPPVVLIVGVLQIAPGSLKSTPYLLALEYVILAMPFAYRAIDAGLRALDLKTVVEAANSLGAGWVSTLWRVVLPNLATAVLSAVVLTVALVLGEYTMASLALFQTFPVWIYVNSQTSGQISVAASLLSLFVTWILLMVITVLGTGSSAGSAAARSTCSQSHVRKRRGAREHQHRQGGCHDGVRPRAGWTRRRDQRAVAGPDPRLRFHPGRWMACPSRSPRASSSRCSARPVAARRPPCASWPASRRPTPARSWSTARTSRRCPPPVVTWAWFSRATACSRTCPRWITWPSGCGCAKWAGASGASGPPSCWTWSGSPRRPGSIRTSCPAASSSAWRWPVRSPSSPLVRPEGLSMQVVENGNGIVTTRTFLGSVTRVGVLLDGDVAVQVDKPSSEAAALAPGASVSVSLPGQPVLVASRRLAAS
jgi:putative spermidine/putrescine transport system permease protein